MGATPGTIRFCAIPYYTRVYIYLFPFLPLLLLLLLLHARMRIHAHVYARVCEFGSQNRGNNGNNTLSPYMATTYLDQMPGLNVDCSRSTRKVNNMGSLANLIETAESTELRKPWTSAQFDALTNTELPPCHCGSHLLAVTHFGEWFCPVCLAWLQTDHDPASQPPANEPAVARRYYSIFGRAVAAHEVTRVVVAIDAVIEPSGEVIYERRRPGMPRRWWGVFDQSEGLI